jgi:hypothetical protein
MVDSVLSGNVYSMFLGKKRTYGSFEECCKHDGCKGHVVEWVSKALVSID